MLEGLTNEREVFLTLYGLGEDGGRGTFTDQKGVTPKEDPVPPQGAFFIDGPAVEQGGDVTTSARVLLKVDAVDTEAEVDGPAAGSGSHSVAHGWNSAAFVGLFQASGDVEMRFGNSEDALARAAWEDLAAEKPWTLDCDPGTICTVFGQFRDGAGNESLVVDQKILYQPGGASLILYLPALRSP